MRKGITPVVAMVLLMLVAIAAAGGLAVWMEGVRGGLIDRVIGSLHTELEVVSMDCNAGQDVIDMRLRNTGSEGVDLRNVVVFVKTQNGQLNSTMTYNRTDPEFYGKEFGERGGLDSVRVNLSDVDSGSDFLVRNEFYAVEIDFARSGYTLQGPSCVAG